MLRELKSLGLALWAVSLLACGGKTIGADPGQGSGSASSSSTPSGGAATASGAEIYRQRCIGCHGDEQGNNAVAGGALTASECRVCDASSTLASFIDIAMPEGKPTLCQGQCSIAVAEYILGNFAGFNGLAEEPKQQEVPLAGDLAACASGPDTAFGGLRRITRVEYQNLISQLFADTTDYTRNFGKDGKLGNFNVNVELPISTLQTDQFLEVGAKVASKAAGNPDRWAPCTREDTACVEEIIDDVVSRAYRRPVTGEEKQRLLGVYASAGGSFEEALETLLQAVLSSPNFLYHLEYGDESRRRPNGIVPLNSHEIAARLSFFLWRSAPDQTLLREAAADRLRTPEQIMAQAERMLADARSRTAVSVFHKEWLRMEDPEPDQANAAAVRANIEDTTRTVTELVFTDNGRLEDLFHVSYGFLSDRTQALYDVSGAPLAPAAEGYAKFALDPDQRGGILSRAAFLGFNTPPSGRGKFIREQVLCGEIPPPPADFIPEIPEGDPDEPPRMRWVEHVSNPACGACHQLMDPLGFAFDHYDRDGHWREMIGRWPVDATGELVETSDIDGFFDGGRELQTLLATSADTQACYSLQWFRFALGREPGLQDSCALARINQTALANDYNIQEIMIALTQTDAFRFRRALPSDAAPQ